MRKFNIYITLYCLLEVLLVVAFLAVCLHPKQIVEYGLGFTIPFVAALILISWISYVGRRIPVKRGDPVIRLSKNHGSVSTIVIAIFAVRILKLINIPNAFMVVLTVAFIVYVMADYLIALRKIMAK